MDRLDPNNYCLILTVENENSINNRRIQETQEFDFRYYEKESINCIKSWRNSKTFKNAVESITNLIQNEASDEYRYLNNYYDKNKDLVRKHVELLVGFTNIDGLV